MTTVTSVMTARAAAAGLAAALLLTGCSSDGDGSGTKESSAAPAASDSASGDDGGSSGAKTKLEGNWLATTDGKPILLFVDGKKAAVFAGTSVCSGKVSDAADMQMIELKCTDGSDDRTSGMVGSVSSKSLTVTWEGGVGEETFQKAEGGGTPSGFPTGLPTAGLG